ncbi:MAG: hypothetical protein ABJC39_04060, partial [Chloroflexota bacterium]
GEVLRDITRGGLAGAIAGILVAGVGGRIVMRLAALLVPAASGGTTENGNRIGDITLSGSLGLVLIGLVIGLMGGTIWVMVSPWIPGARLARAILAMPIAVALVGNGLIEDSNEDFFILRHDPTVVALLVGLVALAGFGIAMIDSWLERRLPHPRLGRNGVAVSYAVVSLVGAILIAMPVAFSYLGSSDPTMLLRGLTMFAVAGCTIAWWYRRLQGRADRPMILTAFGRGTLLIAIVVGFAATLPEIRGALGIY